MARGQTQLDFLIGVGFFLLVVMVVLSTAPSLLTPFVAHEGSTALSADSVATQLTSGVLTEPSDRNVLDRERVDAVFDGDAESLHDRVGVDESVSLNVTLDGASETRRVGPSVPGDATGVSTSWRVVQYNGSRAVLRVTVWR